MGNVNVDNLPWQDRARQRHPTPARRSSLCSPPTCPPSRHPRATLDKLIQRLLVEAGVVDVGEYRT